MKKTKTEYQELKADISSKTQDLDGYKTWAKGFKDIRLMVLDEAISELEVEVNNSLVELGIPDWTIKFDVEREKKTGGFSRGFNVLVKSPHNANQVPWTAWSGGEGQRLRLAGQMGLAGLILGRKGITSSAMFLDEPTKHLSQEGLQDLILFITERSRKTKTQIYLIDHQAFDSSAFTKTMTIVKNAKGSYIQA